MSDNDGVTIVEILEWCSKNNKTPDEAHEHFKSLGRIKPKPDEEPQEVPPYTVEFTELAAAFAKAKWSLSSVEERVRGELAELAQSGCWLPDLWFHTVCMPGQTYASDDLFIVTPSGSGENLTMVVDTGTSEVIAEFAGYKVTVAQGDTE